MIETSGNRSSDVEDWLEKMLASDPDAVAKDDGFTQRVMQALPEKRKAPISWHWVTTLAGGLASILVLSASPTIHQVTQSVATGHLTQSVVILIGAAILATWATAAVVIREEG